MELRSAEEEVASLQDRLVWIKGQVNWFGLDLPAPSEEEDTTGDGPPQSIQEGYETPPKCTAKALQDAMIDYRTRVDKIEPIMSRFRKRLHEKDPVTDKPRYGTQTKLRVEGLLLSYDKVSAIQMDPSLVEDVVIEESKNTEMELQQKRQAELDAKAAKEALEAQAQRVAEANRIDAERKLQAERAAGFERVQREAREAAAAERAWVRSIPRTQESVRAQLSRFQQTTGSIQALKTIFSQILSRPEDESCRRIRRDHPQFLADIGNHDGGKEVLIAGGFELGCVDEVLSFICKEPNVETDLDGWTEWYDRIKSTLQIIEEAS